MSEGIAFLFGMITMYLIWYTAIGREDSPYWRGYKQGYVEAIKAYEKFLERNNNAEDEG